MLHRRTVRIRPDDVVSFFYFATFVAAILVLYNACA